MTYKINAIKERTLLWLNQQQSLCIVTMILSVCLFAINWRASLLMFRLRNSLCRTMVQGYPKADNSCLGFGRSLNRCRNSGNARLWFFPSLSGFQ